jgi:5-formyltetrahydrofolate cyclo-ligase
MTIQEKKKAVRQEIQQQKQLVSSQQKSEAAITVFKQLEMMDEFAKAKNILCYWSLSDELPTHDFLAKWLGKKNFFLPRARKDDYDLDVVYFEGKEKMKRGAYNILEPIGDAISDFHTLDLIIIPGVAFSSKGDRMGRGKGFYDRLLKKIDDCYKIGVGYNFQLKEYIPTEPHDVRINTVLVG